MLLHTIAPRRWRSSCPTPGPASMPAPMSAARGPNTNALWSPLPNSAAFGAFPIAGNTGGSSAIGGLQAGYNWQVAPTWVVGLEGDWSWTEHRLAASPAPWIINPGGGAAVRFFHHHGLDARLGDRSLRARLGYLVTPNLMALRHGGRRPGARSTTPPATTRRSVPPYATGTAFSRTARRLGRRRRPRVDDHHRTGCCAASTSITASTVPHSRRSATPDAARGSRRAIPGATPM